MTDHRDRYRYPPPGPRSPTFNPTRASLPSSVGYSSLYAGDMHVMPSSTSHPVTTPRGYSTTTSAGGVPTTTRTYAVTQDPRISRGPAVPRDHHRTRRSTMESSSRPPVIVTTTSAGKERSHESSSTHARRGSPIRDDYRSSEPQLLSQPASSGRSRSAVRGSYYPTSSRYPEDYPRTRDRENSLSNRDAEAYRSSRPSVMYPSDPRHSTSVVDYGDEGYQYTNAGELVRYDLDHSRPAHSRRRESSDRGYYRPNINYSTEQRSFDINTSPDLSRNYGMNTSRPYEGGRGGPPPSTRGFDRINNRYADGPRERDIASSAAPPSREVEVAAPERREREGGRRSRPVSLYQDSATPRSSHLDDYYRSREDERKMRDLRDRDRFRTRESESAYDPSRFQDDSVVTRGFGVRTEGPDAVPERRDTRREPYREPVRRSDEELPGPPESSRDERRRPRTESRDERGRRDVPESRDDIEETEQDRSRLRDKLSTGLGVAAAAVGLIPPREKDNESEPPRDEPSRRRTNPQERSERPREADAYNTARPSDKGKEKERDESRQDPQPAREARRHSPSEHRNGDGKQNHSDTNSNSETDEHGRRQRSTKNGHGFNPNDAGDIRDLKKELAALNATEKKQEQAVATVPSNKGKDREHSPPHHPPQDHEPREDETFEMAMARRDARERGDSQSPSVDSKAMSDEAEESRGRELTISGISSRHVRVVSPPRDKSHEKPLKGILKQPKASFPEDANPIREGVAPHKDDKKAKEVPPGAKWTKISRKIVSPEALTIGKERFEERKDFCIVLRVLSKDEIQAYAAATQVLREQRRSSKGEPGEGSRNAERDHDHEEDDRREREGNDDEGGERRHHRHYHHRDEDHEDGDREKDRDRDRRRRHHRKDDDDDYDPRSSHYDHSRRDR